MRFGRLGGWLIVGGGALVAVAIVMYVAGDGLGFGSADASGILIDAALALFGLGALALCAVGPAPLHGRLIRAGLGILAIGQLGLLAVSILAAVSTSAPLANQGIVGLFDLASLAAAGLGALLTGLALVRTQDRSRAVGGILVAGMLLLAASAIATDILRQALPGHTVLWALVLVILGDVRVGLLAVDGGRSAVTDGPPRHVTSR
jgi:hypothetical protein